jgi:hypothetical protein
MMTSYYYWIVCFLAISVAYSFKISSGIAMSMKLSMNLYSSQTMGPSPLWYTDTMVKHASYIVKSYHSLTGETLVPLELFESNALEAANKLFFHPTTAVLSHGIRSSDDGPILNYGNSLALQRFGMCWEELTTMPSRYTAGEVDRQEREKDMKTVKECGIIRNYGGVRVALSGKRFLISNAAVWNIVVDGVYLGQAAAFDRWQDL